MILYLSQQAQNIMAGARLENTGHVSDQHSFLSRLFNAFPWGKYGVTEIAIIVYIAITPSGSWYLHILKGTYYMNY